MTEEVTQDIIDTSATKLQGKLNKRGIGLARPFPNEGNSPEVGLNLREDNPEMTPFGLGDGQLIDSLRDDAIDKSKSKRRSAKKKGGKYSNDD